MFIRDIKWRDCDWNDSDSSCLLFIDSFGKQDKTENQFQSHLRNPAQSRYTDFSNLVNFKTDDSRQ